MIAIWHRRAGKDVCAWNSTICHAMRELGTYYYILPTYSQARKIVWEGMTSDGIRMRDFIPRELITRAVEDDMRVELVNGSAIQLVGSDQYDRLVGTNPRGVVFSEYALQHPLAWEYVRPILSENGGWAVFLTTPRGRNHAWELSDLARRTEGWWSTTLTVEDTHAISLDAIQADRLSGMPEPLIKQEYYCSFDAGLVGSYYGELVAEAEHSGRVSRVPVQPSIGVETWWDLGIGDATAIWFTQRAGAEIHVVDYLESRGEGLPWYARQLQERGYVYASHHAPHDIKVRELGTGKSRLDTAASLGIRFELVPSLPVADGIDAARGIIPICWFDAERCAQGLRALRDYHAEYYDQRRVLGHKPVHDWSSHAADAFRYLAVGWKSAQRTPIPSRRPARGTWMSA